MFLNDAYEDILTRKAEEAPGGIAPLNYTWTSPDYDPSKFVAPEGSIPSPLPAQIVITAKKIPPVPAPIQIPLLKFTQAPLTNPWDQITARRAAMPVQSSSNYWPWIIGGLAGVAVLMMLMGGDDKPKKAAARRSPARPRPRAAVRRPAYARRRR